MSPVLVGIDIGTTATKVVVVDGNWRVVARARGEYPTGFPADGAAEQDPAHWWAAASRGIREVLSTVDAADIAAVGVSSQAPSLVALDRAGRVVRPALLWLDRRGRPDCERVDADRILRVSGNRVDSYYAAPKLAWLLRTEPALCERIHSVVMANGYLVHRLTGELSVDSGHTGLTLLNDLDRRCWSPALVDEWGVPPEWLPPVVEPETVVGTVHATASAQTGLPVGTPVVAGLVDGAAASMEAGVLAGGDVCEMTGQSTVVNAAVPVANRSGTGALSVMPYVARGHHLVFGSMVSTGGVLRWFRDRFGDGADFAELDALAATAPPGSGGLVLLPYFLGERSPVWDSDVRGGLFGLSLSTTRAEVARAILEGTAYGLAHNLAELTRMGVEPVALRIVGGGAAGHTWNRIKADVTGLPVELPAESPGAPVGAAMVAACGAGLIDDVAAAVRDRPSVVRRIEPDPVRTRGYRDYYEVYRDLYPALRRVSDRLARLRARSGPHSIDGQ